MTIKLIRRVAFAGLSLLTVSAAMAAPVLKSDVVVASAIVTAGDMFEDAGIYAEEPLFRAPAPGTSGIVGLEAIRGAAARVGLSDFAASGFDSVHVTRSGIVVSEAMLADLISADLRSRGILVEGMSAQTVFDTKLGGLNAEVGDAPAQLASLRYLPGNGGFTARFLINGSSKPVDATGHIELMIEVPHLKSNLAAGTILSAADVELRPVPLRFAESSGFAPLEQLVGKALQHQSRAGLMLRAKDVTEPQLVARNDAVTVYFRNGPLVLTVKGQALNAASAGQPVAVLNQISKKVIHGVAISKGTVEVGSSDISVAGL